MKGLKSIALNSNRLKSIFFVVPVLCLILFGCDETQNGGFSFDFYPDAYTAPDNSITLDALESEDDLMVLVVKAINISYGNIHAAYFDLTFESDVFEFSQFEIGDFFEAGGSVTYQVAIDSQDKDRLIVAVSLLGSGSYATESGFIIKLKFKPIRTGDGYFRFENNSLVEQTDSGIRAVTGIAWFGGYAQVVD
jgi:hypothetical protein